MSMEEDMLTDEEYGRIGRETVSGMRKLVERIQALPDLPECKP